MGAEAGITLSAIILLRVCGGNNQYELPRFNSGIPDKDFQGGETGCRTVDFSGCLLCCCCCGCSPSSHTFNSGIPYKDSRSGGACFDFFFANGVVVQKIAVIGVLKSSVISITRPKSIVFTRNWV